MKKQRTDLPAETLEIPKEDSTTCETDIITAKETPGEIQDTTVIVKSITPFILDKYEAAYSVTLKYSDGTEKLIATECRRWEAFDIASKQGVPIQTV